MTHKETIITSLQEISIDLDNQLLKLSALNEILNFILEGMDKEGNAARRSAANAMQFAARFSGYIEMLCLASNGLMECETAIEALHKQLAQEAAV